MCWGGRMKGQEQTEKRPTRLPFAAREDDDSQSSSAVFNTQAICLDYTHVYAVKWSQTHCTQHNYVGLLKGAKYTSWRWWLPSCATMYCCHRSSRLSKFPNFGIPGQWTTYAGWLMFQNSYFICRQRYADFCIFLFPFYCCWKSQIIKGVYLPSLLQVNVRGEVLCGLATNKAKMWLRVMWSTLSSNKLGLVFDLENNVHIRQAKRPKAALDVG